MESHGVPCMTHLSDAAHAALRRPAEAHARHRGSIEVKGLGPMETYLVAGITDSEQEAADAHAHAHAHAPAAAADAHAAADAGSDADADADAPSRGSGRLSVPRVSDPALRGGRTRAPRGSCEMHISDEERAAEAAMAALAVGDAAAP
jgi:hypothetical protein